MEVQKYWVTSVTKVVAFVITNYGCKQIHKSQLLLLALTIVQESLERTHL